MLLALVTGCYAATERSPELLECGPSPYVDDRSLWRHESPPRGRIWACEACARSESEILARAVELGCPLGAAHHACALTGACAYEETIAWERAVREATSCTELADLAAVDPCTRPDPTRYWRREGD